MAKEKTALKALMKGNVKTPVSPTKWITVDMSELGYGGKYYPNGSSVEISKMNVKTLQWIGGINLENPVQLATMWGYVVAKHARVRVPSVDKPLSGNYLFGLDRTKLLMKIRELNKFENPLQFKSTCGSCNHKQFNHFTPDLITVTPDHINKYWDGKVFAIGNEHFSKVWYYLPATLDEVSAANELLKPLVDSGEMERERVMEFSKVFTFLRDHPSDTDICKKPDNTMKTYLRRFNKELSDSDMEELQFLTQYVLDGTEEGTVTCKSCFQESKTWITPTDWTGFIKSKREFTI